MRVLMCPPQYFDVPIEDKARNPWMNIRQKPNPAVAMRQWQGLLDFYASHRLGMWFLRAQEGLFDQVFTANIAWHKGNQAVIARLAPEWRRPEEKIVREWFVRERYQVVDLPEEILFEGQGDVLSIGESGYLFCYGIRNNFKAMDFLERSMNLKGKFIPLKLVNPQFYHGDVCIRYSRHRNALLYNPLAFDAESLRRIELLPLKKMAAPKAMWVQETPNGRNFPLNGCYVDKIETFPWDTSLGPFPAEVRAWIEQDGGVVWTSNYDQFGLSGAGHRCCSYFLD